VTGAAHLFRRFLEVIDRGMASPTFQNTLWLGSASVLTGVVGAVSSALYARYLGVGDFGVLILILTILTAMSDLSDLGLSNSLIRFGSRSVAEGDSVRLKTVLSIVFRAKLIVAGILLLVAIGLVQPFVRLVFDHVDEKITFYFLFSLAAVALNAVASIFAPLFQAFKRFRVQSLLSVLRSAVKLLLLLLCILILTQISVTLIIWIEIVSLLLYLGTCYYFSPVKSFSLFSRDQTLQREIFSFNKWISLYQIIALVGGRLDILLVGGLANANALGLYGAASKIAFLLITVANSYLTVLLPEFSSCVSFDDLKRRQRNAGMGVAFIALCILLLGILADPLVRVIFGEEFTEAASVFRIMCAGVIFTVLGYPFNATLFAMNKSAVFPVISAVSMTTFVIANIYLIPQLGVNGAAIAYSTSSGVAFLVSLAFYRSIVGKVREREAAL